MEQLLGDLLKIVIPAGMILYAMYLVVKSFLSKDFERRLVDLKVKNTEIVLPIRLQAYERMSLFLERISLSHLIVRVNDPSYNVAQFQQILLAEIRNEFQHNLSQQVYMSDQTWILIKKAMEDIVSTINLAGSVLPSDARGIELARKVFEIQSDRSEDPTAPALKFLKDEIRKVF
ncbi:MAG TPA: hypothetical protein VK750_01350 [Cytophagaceae bacterium]|jgi:hypothetical protein|nr:hypothetical protein [Cytophagaceae bacterium]